MNLLFLDFDGVIINRPSARVRYDNPDAGCVARLNTLIEQTDTRIVMTGAWRMDRSVKELQGLIAECGIKGVVVDKTPSGAHGCQRGDEIGAFLRDWKGEKIQSFVILDQHADFGQFLPRLVHTRFDTGLTKNDIEMARKMLVNTL